MNDLVRLILRPRALLLLILVLALVVIAMIASFTRSDTAGTATGPAPAWTAVPASTSPADTPPPAAPAPAGSDVDDTGTDPSFQPAAITTGPHDPTEAATVFLTKWLNTLNKTPDQWQASMHGYVTPELAGLLAETDMTRIPAGVVGSPLTMSPAGDQLVAVSAPIVTRPTNTLIATVRLTLVGTSHQWLVSEIDSGS